MPEINGALNTPHRAGVVSYCNRLNQGTYVIPDEVQPTVRKVLGIELSERSYALLLAELTTNQLRAMLESNGLPTSGTKDGRIRRIIASGMKPRVP